MLATSVKLQSRPGDEVRHRARDEHFTSSSERTYALTDMHSYAADVVVTKLHFARVKPCANFDAKWSHGFADRQRATHRARGTIERREDTIPGRVDLATAMTFELPGYEFVMAVEEVGPPLVAEAYRVARRADDVGEEDGGKRTVVSRTGGAPVMNSSM